MPRIYLLSQPDDAADLADLLADRLRKRYGAKRIFRNKPASSDAEFVQQAERDIRSCDVVVAVIGSRWIAAREQSARPPASQTFDPLSVGLALALKTQKLIAPVLRDGAVMPSADALPADLQRLPQYQAFPVRPAPLFTGDMQALVEQINTKLTWRPASVSLTLFASLAFVATVALPTVYLTYDNNSTYAGVVVVFTALDLFAVVLLFLGIMVSGVVLAARRKRWRWLYSLVGTDVIALLALASILAYDLIAPDQLDAYWFIAQFVAPMLLVCCASVFLIFALFGPRRETAFA